MAESHPLDIHIGLRLRRIRTSKKLSLERVGEWLDLSKQQVSRFEQGQSRLSVLHLYLLARGMDIPVSWFFEGYEDSPEEVAWISTMTHEDRGEWRPSADDDKAEQVMALWRMLPSKRQRDQILRMLETFAVG